MSTGHNVLGIVNASVTVYDVYRVVKARYKKATLLLDECTILFSDDSEARTLSVVVNHEVNLPWIKKDHSAVTSLILGDWGAGADLMLEIVQAFGGYVRLHEWENWEAVYKEEDDRESYL
jgi:hypothetical protein